MFQTVRRLLERGQPDDRLWWMRLDHWREGRDEVDLVLDLPGRPLAFEIASSTRHDRRGLHALLKRHPRFSGGAYLVSPDAPVRHPLPDGDGLGTLPLDALLLSVGQQSALALDRTLGPAAA